MEHRFGRTAVRDRQQVRKEMLLVLFGTDGPGEADPVAGQAEGDWGRAGLSGQPQTKIMGSGESS